MPTTRMEIENANGRWVAEVEIGGYRAKRVHIVETDFDVMWDQVKAKYHELIAPAPEPVAPVAVQAPLPQPKPRRTRRNAVSESTDQPSTDAPEAVAEEATQ